jgi:hypothetical protein
VTTKRDAHYTPASIAKALIGSVGKNLADTVLDPAVGSGELLAAASLRWPSAELFGCDIDSRVAATTRRANAAWQISNSDFLSVRSRSASTSLRRLVGHVEVALMNPPFSCRGGQGMITEFEGRPVRCSPGLAFVLGVHKYMAEGGEVATLLPAGSLSNERDQVAWALLEQHYLVDLIEEHEIRAFPNVATRVVSVLLTRVNGSVPPKRISGAEPRRADFTVGIERGTYQMYRVRKINSGLPLIHSTDLRDGRVQSFSATVSDGRRLLSPPAVVIQRVGLPDSRKVAVLDGTGNVILSDCCIGLSCSSRTVARGVRKRLLDNWGEIEGAFGGSCAPFLTLARLKVALSSMGIKSISADRAAR